MPFAVTWADTSILRFPNSASPGVQVKATIDLPALADGAAAGTYHIVMTYSHALDLAICHAVLRRGEYACCIEHGSVVGSPTVHGLRRTIRVLKQSTQPLVEGI